MKYSDQPMSTDLFLSQGKTGQDVKDLQARLVLLGYDVGSAGIDGDFGPDTMKALSKFQKDQGLDGSGVGSAGALTLGRLNEAVYEHEQAQDSKKIASIDLSSVPIARNPLAPIATDNTGLHINAAGLAIIKDPRNERPPKSSVIVIDGVTHYKPYNDKTGVWTIGYGHTGGITSKTPPITQAQADVLFHNDLVHAENIVKSNVKVPLNENQFSALVSFVFNEGEKHFSGSTLLRDLNSHDYQAAAKQFEVWNKGRIGGKLVPLGGLTARRKTEEELFNTPVTKLPAADMNAPISLINTGNNSKKLLSGGKEIV